MPIFFALYEHHERERFLQIQRESSLLWYTYRNYGVTPCISKQILFLSFCRMQWSQVNQTMHVLFARARSQSNCFAYQVIVWFRFFFSGCAFAILHWCRGRNFACCEYFCASHRRLWLGILQCHACTRKRCRPIGVYVVATIGGGGGEESARTFNKRELLSLLLFVCAFCVWNFPNILSLIYSHEMNSPAIKILFKHIVYSAFGI